MFIFHTFLHLYLYVNDEEASSFCSMAALRNGVLGPEDFDHMIHGIMKHVIK